MNDYTAMKLHRMRVEEFEREAMIRAALEMPVEDQPARRRSLTRIVSLIVRRSKRAALTAPEFDYSPRTPAMNRAES